MKLPHSDVVSLKTLSNELALDRPATWRFIKRHGFQTFKQVTIDSSGRQALCVTKKTAEQIKHFKLLFGHHRLDLKKQMSNDYTNFFYIAKTNLNIVQIDIINSKSELPRIPHCFWACSLAWITVLRHIILSESSRVIDRTVIEVFDFDRLQSRIEKFFLIVDPELKINFSKNYR